MTDEELQAEDARITNDAIEILKERFENITIFGNRFSPETGNTLSYWVGYGNWHARHGQIIEWIIKQNTQCEIDQKEA